MRPLVYCWMFDVLQVDSRIPAVTMRTVSMPFTFARLHWKVTAVAITDAPFHVPNGIFVTWLFRTIKYDMRLFFSGANWIAGCKMANLFLRRLDDLSLCGIYEAVCSQSFLVGDCRWTPALAAVLVCGSFLAQFFVEDCEWTDATADSSVIGLRTMRRFVQLFLHHCQRYFICLQEVRHWYHFTGPSPINKNKFVLCRRSEVD